jgi:hypothetical protein
MQKNILKINRGTTLIETIVYLALFVILFGGAVVAAYNLIESNGRTQTHVLLQEEGNFLVGKINWVLSGVESVQMPGTNLSGSTLKVVKYSPSTLNPLVLTLNSGNMTLSTNNDPNPPTLNNTNVTISNLSFTQIYTGGTNPISVKFSFTLTAKTQNLKNTP